MDNFDKVGEAVTNSIEETRKLAFRWASDWLKNRVCALDGPLGAGKTEFVRGAVKGLGADSGPVRSPSFTLLNIYDAEPPIYHFDLFRLNSIDDLEGIGFWDFISQGTVFIEWALKFEELKEIVDFIIEIEGSKNHRRFTLFKRRA